MDLSENDASASDDEIFFGKITSREVKKCFGRLRCGNHRQTITVPPNVEKDRSFQIIEAKSEPDLLRDIPKLNNDNEIEIPSSINYNKYFNLSLEKDDSFLQLEAMVSELNIPSKRDNIKTPMVPEVVGHVSKNAQGMKCGIKNTGLIRPTSRVNATPITKSRMIPDTSETQKYFTPCQNTEEDVKLVAPMSRKNNENKFSTPMSRKNSKLPISSAKSMRLKPNLGYDHVASPVASYIHDGSRTPLLKNVHLKKSMSVHSSIPKPVKTAQGQYKTTLHDKENIDLPLVGYEMAKKVQLVDVPSAKKLPESRWPKKTASSIPKAMIIKHEQRENNMKRKVQGGTSFNITLNQAETSVCTQQSAISKEKPI